MADRGAGLPRVLYAEDDDLLSSVIAECLLDAGYFVRVAADGMEGLRLAALGGFDIVLTDLDMPRISGMQMIAALRAEDPRLPVVVLSGNPPEGGYAAFAGMGDGPMTLLAKPVPMRELTEAIMSVWSRRA